MGLEKNSWPFVNSLLNLTSSLFLIAGFYFVKKKNIPRHRLCMLSAFAASVIFLASYLTYHAFHGSTRFPGIGVARTLYFTILISHTVLAMIVAPLVVRVLYLALRGEIDKHRPLARIVHPIWLYVSITGVIVYLMLYQITWIN